VSDFQLYQIAATELAVDGKIKKRPISHPSFTIEARTDSREISEAIETEPVADSSGPGGLRVRGNQHIFSS